MRPTSYSTLKVWTITLLLAFVSLYAERPNPTYQPQVYSQISDIDHPALNDYRLIQNYLKTGERKYLKQVADPFCEYFARNITFVGEKPEEVPQFDCIPVNSTPQEKENCVLIYSSFNRNYPKGLKRLVKHIKESDFKGHILYQLGGWPNTEDGCLLLTHVPYAFKVSFFKKAQRLGYKQALWLDTAAVPAVSLNEIFKLIKEKGYFVFGNQPHMCGTFMNAPSAEGMGITLEEASKIPSCSAGLLGIDFTNDKSVKIIDLWYKAAQDKNAFFSKRADQNCLSIILYQLGLVDFISLDRMPHAEIGQTIGPNSLFLLDRLYIQ